MSPLVPLTPSPFEAPVVHTDGGTFDRTGAPLYFIATGPTIQQIVLGMHPHTLIAVNELKGKSAHDLVQQFIDAGCKVLLDSGIFNLTNEHMRKHGISMDRALALAPAEIDGFAALRDRYCAIVERFRYGLWGYVELDQGGRENKKITRAALEADGFRPIPVYHPLNDGWDYFDELARRYDRICVGNIVQASGPLRVRLLATLWERRRQYPHLWIHLLGMSPHQWLNAYPQTSCDSSTWISANRWGRSSDTSMLQKMAHFDTTFAYDYDEEAADLTRPGWNKSARFAAMCAHMTEANWRGAMRSYAALGFDHFRGVAE